MTLAEVDELKKKLVDIIHPDDKWITDELIKTKKVSACCQGHTGNGPHPCGVGVGVPDGGLARPQNKNKRNKKNKNHKSNYLSNVTLVVKVKHTKQFYRSQVSTKIKKVSACCQGHTGNGPHPCGVGVGVPDGGLARPQNKNKRNKKRKKHKSNYLSNVTLVVRVKHTKQFYQSQVSTKIKKVLACCQGHTGNGPHPCGVGVGVPDGGLARPKLNYWSHVTLVDIVKFGLTRQKQKNIRTKNSKNKNYFKDITLVRKIKLPAT